MGGNPLVHRIVSGGQTGVDRAALDVALARGISCGGWCPNGRRAEDGPIAARYPLCETESMAYRARTRRNVRESDATLVLAWGAPAGGTRLTVDYVAALGRPVLVLDLDGEDPARALARTRAWLTDARPATLNVAGPRESSRPGAYAAALPSWRSCWAGEGRRRRDLPACVRCPPMLPPPPCS